MRFPLFLSLSAALVTAAALSGFAAAPAVSRAGMPRLSRQEPTPALATPDLRRSQNGRVSLLDEVGRLAQKVSAVQVARWKAELQTPAGKKRTPERVGQLHLWLGEYKLAGREDPEGAAWHFRTVQRLPGKSAVLARLKGRASLDLAIGRFFRGAYEEATHRFKALLSHKTRQPGYDRREAALWYRHAAACYGYHQRRAAAGITEPEEIDPYCGAAGLAVVLRALGRPYDRASVTKVCRVTGFGSNLQDLRDAARKLGLSSHALVLDEAGMKAIPKPVIVHVEHDHFVVLLRADDRGVTYGCSDCGQWPGGRRDVTWEQWRLMEPGAVAAIYRPGSVADRAVQAALAGRRDGEIAGRRDGGTAGQRVSGIDRRMARTAEVRLAALPEVRGALVGQLSTLTSALRGHVTAYIAIAVTTACGSHPDGQHCEPDIECCLDCPQDNATGNAAGKVAGGIIAYGIKAAPSTGDPVNLATGEEEYHPPADLEVYNPTGPSVSWGRIYNSLRGLNWGYACDDFGAGWSHPYNVVLQDPTVRMNPQVKPGVQSAYFSSTGSQAPGTGLSWDIVRNGSTVASSATANGWSIQTYQTAVRVTPPAATASGTGYLVRWEMNYYGNLVTYSAPFDVLGATELLAGTTGGFAHTANNAPATGLTWDVRLNGTTVATSAVPAGWQVSYVGYTTPPFQIKPPLTATPATGYEVRYLMTGMGMGYSVSAPFSVAPHRYLPAGGTKYVIWPNGSRTGFSASSTPTPGNPVVLTPTSPGKPYFMVWEYSATHSMGVMTLVHADRSRWSFGLPGKVDADGAVYSRLTHVADPVGNYIQLQYGPIATKHMALSVGYEIFSGFPLLSAILDSSGAALLSFTRATDGSGLLLGVHDRYNRSVYYHASQFNTVNVPAPHPAYFLQVDQVSQIVPTGTASPPLRFQYGYTSLSIGHSSPLGDEECPFLTHITTPSPTGSGTATATIEYEPDTCYVKAVTDGNGNRREYTATAADATQVVVKNSLGVAQQSWTTTFNSDMTHATRTDGSNTVLTEQRLYGDPNSPSQPSSIKDGDNRETLLTYDSFGNVLTATSPKGTVTTYTYDYHVFPLGRLLSVQEGSKTPTTFTYYEPSGLVQSVSTPVPGTSGGSTVTTSFTYNSLGDVLTVTTPGNNAAATKTITFNYTSDGTYSQPARLGQPLTATDPLGQTTHFRYDARGNTVLTADALLIETAVAYNLADQPTQATLPPTGQNGTGNSATLNTYQYVGGPLANTKLYDESGAQIRQVSYAYGPEGELLSVTGSTEPVSYTYDPVYRLKTLSDGKGQTTTYTYHPRGYLAQVVYPGTDTVSYPSYAADGQLLQRVDGRGVVTNYVYNDPDGLLSAIQYPATPGLNVGMSYDGYGRLTGMTDGQGSHGYSYDDHDALTSETTTYTGLPGKTLSYSYYADGSRSGMSGFAGSFSYLYDAAGRMVSTTNPFSETTSWTYLNNDWLKTQQLHNSATTTYTYDALARVTDLVTRSGPGAMDPLLSSFTGMVHDGAGNRLSLNASIPAHAPYSGTTSYTYDTKDQLTQESSTRAGGYTNNFVYDPAGNPTSFKGVPHVYNANNQDTGNVYDGNGNPTTYKGVTCTFDPENRMTSYGAVMTAGYRGDGLRAWKQTAAGRTYFLYDGEILLAEMNPAGTVTAVNTWGAAGLVSRSTSAGTVFYTFDPQGSVAQRLDGAGGVLTSHIWDGFGTGAASAAFSDPHGYAGLSGYRWEPESSLYLCSFRYFDPASGQWVTRDPIGYPGGVNLYSYVMNQPVSQLDPAGLQAGKANGPQVWDIGVGGGGYGGGGFGGGWSGGSYPRIFNFFGGGRAANGSWRWGIRSRSAAHRSCASEAAARSF